VRSFYRVRVPQTIWRPDACAHDARDDLSAAGRSASNVRPTWRTASRGSTCSRQTWSHADREKPAPALRVRGTDPGATDLVLVVHEGDNSPPWPLASARLIPPSYRVRLFDPGDAAAALWARRYRSAQL
jgi:hypothetical protein